MTFDQMSSVQVTKV